MINDEDPNIGNDFDNMWIGHKIKEGVHLMSWERLASSKSYGGWGIEKKISIWESSCCQESIEGPLHKEYV